MNDVELFVEQQRSDNTKRAYRLDLERWFNFVAGQTPDMELAVTFKNDLSAHLAPASAARAFNTVRAFYRWRGGENPTDRIKSPARLKGQLPTVPKDADVERMLAAIETDTVQGLCDKAIITLLLNGLRAEEVADLARDGMTFEDSVGSWVLWVVGKGRKARPVPANPEAVAAVQAFQSAAVMVTPWTLYDVRGLDSRQLTPEQVKHAVYRWAKRAGVEGMHPHALRHHYATRLVRQNVNILHVQRLLGHARADTTQVYVGLDLADLVDAARMDPRAKLEERPMLRVVGE